MFLPLLKLLLFLSFFEHIFVTFFQALCSKKLLNYILPLFILASWPFVSVYIGCRVLNNRGIKLTLKNCLPDSLISSIHFKGHRMCIYEKKVKECFLLVEYFFLMISCWFKNSEPAKNIRYIFFFTLCDLINNGPNQRNVLKITSVQNILVDLSYWIFKQYSFFWGGGSPQSNILKGNIRFQ